MNKTKMPINHSDSGELLGFVAESHADSWEAQTVFGYVIDRLNNQSRAERLVRNEGLSFMKGVWQYFDKDDDDWYSCIIKDANQVRVTVVRTNAMGYQEPKNYKMVIIDSPDETKLIKSQ